MMKKILRILIIAMIAFTILNPTEQTIGMKFDPYTDNAWHLRGINNEQVPSILFGNNGFSPVVDMCYDSNNRLYAAWIDNNALGEYAPCYAFYDHYGWKYYSDFSTGKTENGYCYIGYGKFKDPAMKWKSTNVRIISTDSIVLAVYVVQTKTYGTRLYYSKLSDVNGTSTDCAAVNPSMDDGQENSLDLARIYNYGSHSYTIYMTYTKEINGVRQVCVTYFKEDNSKPQGGEWYKVEDSSVPGYPHLGYTLVDTTPFMKDNPKIAVNKENPYPYPIHRHPFAISYERLQGSGNNDIYFTWWNTQMALNQFCNALDQPGQTQVCSTTQNSTMPHIVHKGGNNYYVAWVEKHPILRKNSIAVSFLDDYAQFKDLDGNQPFGFIQASGNGGDANNPFIHPTNLVGEIQPIIVWDQNIGTAKKVTRAVFHTPSGFNKLMRMTEPGASEINNYLISGYRDFSNCRLAPGPGPYGGDYNNPIIFGTCFKADSSDNYFAKLSFHPNPNSPVESCVKAVAKIPGAVPGFSNRWLDVNEKSVIEIRLDTYGLQISQMHADTFLYAVFEPSLRFKNINTNIIPSGLQFKENSTAMWTNAGSLIENQEIAYLRIKPEQLMREDSEVLLMQFYTSILPNGHPGDSDKVIPLHYYNYFFIDDQNSTNYMPIHYPSFYTALLPEHKDFIGLNLPSVGDFLAVGNSELSVDRGWFNSTSIKIVNPFTNNPMSVYEIALEDPATYPGLSIDINPFEGMFNNKNEAISNFYVEAAKDAPLLTYTVLMRCFIYSSPQKIVIMATRSFYINVKIKTPELVGQKTAKKSYAVIGDYIDYFISVKNIGDGIAHFVEIIDPLPRELTYISSQPSAIAEGDFLKWSIEQLMPGQSFVIQLKAKVRDDLGLRTGYLIINTARIKSQLDGFSSNVSVMIQPSVPGSTNPQAELVIKNIKRGNIVYANEPMEGILKVLSGAGPFTASIIWGDSTRQEGFAIGETNTKTVSHTYTQPGDYTIITTVRDDYGKFTNIYKHIRVISR